MDEKNKKKKKKKKNEEQCSVYKSFVVEWQVLSLTTAAYSSFLSFVLWRLR